MVFLKHHSLKVIGFLFMFGVILCAQDEVIKAFETSYIQEREGQYLQAAETLMAVYDKDSYEVNLRLGWLYYLGGKMDKSETYYRSAVKIHPYAIEPRLGLAYPLSSQGKWGEIEAMYLDILEMDPQNTLINYRMGLICYNRAEYEKADRYLQKVLNLYPFDYDTLLLSAWTKLRLQKVREAKILFYKTLMASPGDSSALEGLAMLP
ncbi:MAG: tetratricopeptide repeat protein [Candidatus Marinimicrobia bacterium]|nr:tetratricopeptide repeat protein [Candidatus Neomarinimicrobiota bacterium]